MMDLNQIYSARRLGKIENTDTRTAYQRDFDRIIFSSAFRRLQNKTQVFPMPGSIFVHNRLTHSLEVASVGRSLGGLAGEMIIRNYTKKLDSNSKHFYQNDLYNVISSACLCHDIGNPAFGHSGEDAIASYFIENEKKLKTKFTEKEWADFINFEGNANAIRILTQIQNNKYEGSISLTFATMASIAKYPCEAIASNKKFLYRKKFGFFQAEKESFNKIATRSQMINESETPLIYKRHPFVWLVEAADDICYNIIDLEDSHRLGIIDHDKCKDLLLDLIDALAEKGKDELKNRHSLIKDKNELISFLRAKVIGKLTQRTAEVYEDNFKEILAGKNKKSLLKQVEERLPQAGQVMQEIEEFSIENIYNHYSVVEIENAGYNVMHELLDHFVIPVLKSQRSTREEKALELIPKQFLYEEDSDYKKVLGVLDFVSGMTDNYATELYRRIKGIEIGMRR